MACCLLAVAAVAGSARADDEPADARTWVSGVGDDSNPCTRTAPCLTLDRALAVTPAGGEVDALDQGSYGTAVVDKAVTIDLSPQVGGIDNGVVDGITVDAGAGDDVVLRSLTINGATPRTCAQAGATGIVVRNARTVSIEHVTIAGQAVADIAVAPTASNPLVTLNGVALRNGCGTGLAVDPAAGHTATVMVRNGVISGGAVGVHAGSGGLVILNGSTVTGNALGLDPVGTGRIEAYINAQIYGNANDGILSAYIGWAEPGATGATGAAGAKGATGAAGTSYVDETFPLDVTVPTTIRATPSGTGTTISFRCEAAASATRLTACVVSVFASRASIHAAQRLHGRSAHQVLIGTATATSAGTRAIAVVVRLNAVGRQALRDLPELPIEVALRATDTTGAVASSTATSTIRPRTSVIIPSDGIFASDSWHPDAAGLAFIGRVRQSLGTTPVKRLTCTGYTDSTGLPEDNLWLGRMRAQTVCDALVADGLRVTTVVIASQGESNPRATNDTAAGRALNRRIALSLTY